MRFFPCSAWEAGSPSSCIWEQGRVEDQAAVVTDSGSKPGSKAQVRATAAACSPSICALSGLPHTFSPPHFNVRCSSGSIPSGAVGETLSPASPISRGIAPAPELLHGQARAMPPCALWLRGIKAELHLIARGGDRGCGEQAAKERSSVGTEGKEATCPPAAAFTVAVGGMNLRWPSVYQTLYLEMYNKFIKWSYIASNYWGIVLNLKLSLI